MSGVLVLAESRRGKVRDISFELIEAGKQLVADAGGPLVVVLAADAAVAEALGIEGVDEVVVVRPPAAQPVCGEIATALSGLSDELEPDVVIVGQTVDGLAVGPAVAVGLGLGFASDVFDLRHGPEGLSVRRGAFGDRLTARIDFPGKDRVLVMVRQGAYEPASGSAPVPVRTVAPATETDGRVEYLGLKEPEASDVDITSADFLLSIGRGIEDEEGVERFQILAEKLGATLSGSRPLVDAGWLASARQVGQSGNTVTPRVYLALGISGAIQHLAGVQAETVIAVNTDPTAPIFAVADFAAVVDMFELADELEQSAG